MSFDDLLNKTLVIRRIAPHVEHIIKGDDPRVIGRESSGEVREVGAGRDGRMIEPDQDIFGDFHDYDIFVDGRAGDPFMDDSPVWNVGWLLIPCNMGTPAAGSPAVLAFSTGEGYIVRTMPPAGSFHAL